MKIKYEDAPNNVRGCLGYAEVEGSMYDTRPCADTMQQETVTFLHSEVNERGRRTK